MTGYEELNISDPAEAEKLEIRDMYAFWKSGLNEAGLFPYRNFDVLDLPKHLLPLIYLIRVHRKELQFEVRIVGQSLIESSGYNVTGKFVHEVPGGERTQARFEYCVTENRPYASVDQLSWAAHDFKTYSVGTFPFHDEDGQVSNLLSVMCID